MKLRSPLTSFRVTSVGAFDLAPGATSSPSGKDVGVRPRLAPSRGPEAPPENETGDGPGLRDACPSGCGCSVGLVCSSDDHHRVVAQSAVSQVGRPFRVWGEDRVAPLTSRDDWAVQPSTLGFESLSASLRAQLGAYWAHLGQLEHASVAAFSRFALQLLALGAPSGLVAGAQEAMGDEIEHARLCFGLASALLGRPAGPGPLALGGALDGSSLPEVVRLAVLEGCVGETLGALEAAEALERASEPSVRLVLGRVREDEMRHAELAWRFVGWALEVGGDAVREAAAEAFSGALDVVADEAFDAAAGEEEAAGGRSAQAEAFGQLPARVRVELRRRALREVVGPCVEQMLEAADGQSAGRHDGEGEEDVRAPGA